MEKQTALQFQPTQQLSLQDGASQLHSQCSKCERRFRAGARFCPYDGQALEEGAEAARDPLIGSVIDGRYEVQSTLGEGGMGVVYRVRHSVLGREFALKALRADLAQEEPLGERFLREAQSAASINHPNVCEITDFGELPGKRPYFVMELLTGEALSLLLRREGPLAVERVVRLGEQVARALDAAHRAGVVHRDLKPDNILVDVGPAEERVKVVDFGLAQIAGQSRLTQPGVVFGTPHYMSPEQASGGQVDQRADIYALGVVMYEMLTGKVPFEAETYMGVLSKHLYLEPAAPSSVPGSPPFGDLEAIVMRCIRKQPSERYGSMSELLGDFARVSQPRKVRAGAALGQSEAAATETAAVDRSAATPSTSPQVVFHSNSRLSWFAALGAGALLVLGVAFFLRKPAPADDAPLAGKSAATSSAAALAASAVSSVASESSPLVRGPASDLEVPAVGGTASVAATARVVPPRPAKAEAPEASASAVDPTAPEQRLPVRKKRANFQTSEIIDPWSQ
jgi:eukaryotic-like serine/threonine-protein kinase